LVLKEILKEHHPRVNYHIIDKLGRENESNCHSLTPIAVTWGVFPGQEVLQPTVVDPISFKTWKDEAFSLWDESWASLYPDDSQSRQVLKDVCNSYFLINLVDNDYMKETCLWDILNQVLKTVKK
jgi:methylenetetrahydrofolate reductase (NADPH)